MILDTPAGGNGGLDDDEDDQYVVQDSTPLEIPSTDLFLPHSIDDKPEGPYACTTVIYTCLAIYNGVCCLSLHVHSYSDPGNL